jgi:hypothetical protein
MTQNGQLYAKLLVSLEGSALQSIVSHKHLCDNSLLLLQEFTQTYKPKNVFLPSHWYTQDWPALLVLCRDYFNSVKPQGVPKHEQSSETDFDTKSYTTDECSIKKDCDRLLANLKHCASSSSPNAGSSGYLHHIKDDILRMFYLMILLTTLVMNQLMILTMKS